MKKKISEETEKSSENEKDKLKRCAINALDKLVEIAECEDTDTKAKIDAYKWLCEMYFGKPQSLNRGETETSKTLHLSFEGDLDKWSN